MNDAKIRAYMKPITDAMPDDFKDWHENDPREWPEVAAMVIDDLRLREAQAWAELGDRWKPITDTTPRDRDVFLWTPDGATYPTHWMEQPDPPRYTQ